MKYKLYSYFLSFPSTDFLKMKYSPRNIPLREQKQFNKRKLNIEYVLSFLRRTLIASVENGNKPL